jgi:transposase
VIQDDVAGTISKDLRKRAVAEYLRGGMTFADIAEQFSIGVASINRWMRLHRETGDITPRARGGGAPAKLDEDCFALLRQLVAQQPDSTLAELRAALAEQRGVQVTITTVHRALGRMGLTRKKRFSMLPSKRAKT